jgi:hypothetical protein
VARTTIIVEGLEEIRSRFRRFPDKYHRATKTTMEASLLTVWESVPPYPEEPPDSSYTRTGTLGRTLGSGETGGRQGGQPDIYEINQGSSYIEGAFGTRLGYAPHVIGDPDTEQAWMHQGRWWTLVEVLQRAATKIERLWDALGDELAAWLDGRST